MIGRVRARVPDVMGERDSGWALPCAPFGGDKVGFFAVPAVGAGVWIEFEHGDPDYPIWAGCWWGSVAEMPPTLLAPPPPSKKVMLRTEAGHSILVDDTPGVGGITLETAYRAEDRADRDRHRDRQRDGRQDHPPGPAGVGEQRRAGGAVMPGYVLHVRRHGAVRPRRAGQPDGAQPAGERRRSAGDHAVRPVRRGGLSLHHPGRAGALRDRAVDGGRDAGPLRPACRCSWPTARRSAHPTARR